MRSSCILCISDACCDGVKPPVVRTISGHRVTDDSRCRPFPQQILCRTICRPAVCAMPPVLTKENTMSSTSDDEEVPMPPPRKKSRAEQSLSTPRRRRAGDSGHQSESSPASQAYTSLVQGYRELAQELSNLDIRPENTVQNARRATTLIDQADELADRAYNANGSAAATYDGEFMNVAGHVVHRIAETMEVDTRIFTVREFVDCLKKNVFGSRNAPVTKSGLCDFGRKFCRIQSSAAAPVLKFVHGAYDFTRTEVPAETSRPAPRKRTRLVVSPTKTHASVIRSDESLEKVDKDKTVIEVEKFHAEILNMYKRSGRKPLPYLSLVVDANDFGKSVENVFHFSFLVKEGYDRVVSHNGVTSVIPIEEEDERKAFKSSADRTQLVFSFSQKDWIQWCEKIKGPSYRVR